MGKDRFRAGGSKDRGPKFVKLDFYLLKSSAWQDLDPVARALYIEIRQRFNGSNNGSVGLGTREASEALKVGRTTIQRAFDALVSHGFIEIAKLSGFHQKRMTREWLLTNEKDDRTGQQATKAFMQWQPAFEKTIGPPQDRIGPPQDRSFSRVAHHSAHRSPGGPMGDKTADLQARTGTTYRSTTGGAA